MTRRLLFALCLLLAATPALAGVFLVLKDADAPPTFAYGISADGRLVIGESFTRAVSDHGQGVMWERGSAWTPKGLGLPAIPPGALNSPAQGLGRDKSVVVGRCSFNPPLALGVDTQAYCWESASGFKMLPMPPAYVVAQASGSSRYGHTIVGSGSMDLDYRHNQRPLVWRRVYPGPWTVSELHPDDGYANAVEPSGTMIVGWARHPSTPSTVPHGAARAACVWIRSASKWKQVWLPALPPDVNSGYAVSIASFGRFVVGASGSVEASRPVMWKVNSSGFVSSRIDLGMLDKFTTGIATGVSKDGRRVVGVCSRVLPDGAYEYEAFVWEKATGIRTLRELVRQPGSPVPPNWDTLAATGISDDGRTICGYGRKHGATEESSWVAYL